MVVRQRPWWASRKNVDRGGADELEPYRTGGGDPIGGRGEGRGGNQMEIAVQRESRCRG